MKIYGVSKIPNNTMPIINQEEGHVFNFKLVRAIL